MEKLGLMADEDVGEVVVYIFLHPHYGQNPDQHPLVCQEAKNHKTSITTHSVKSFLEIFTTLISHHNKPIQIDILKSTSMIDCKLGL